MRKLLYLILLSFIVIGNVYAYEQKGYVKTIGRPGKKGQRIANVSIYPKKGQGNSTKSDINGDFSMTVNRKSFYISEVAKNGYEPIDADLFSTQFDYSETLLVILLANSAELREERNKVSRALYEELEQKFKKQQEKLNKLFNEKKISEEKYREEINLLYSKYDKNDALVREMAEKYSKLDFDQLNETDQKVSELIMNGKLTEADSLLRTKGDINKRRKELDALNAANDEVRNNLEKSEAVAKAQTDELAADYFHHFEICKLSLEFDSASYYIKERASLFNSTNIDFLNEAGEFFRDYACIYDEALLFYEKALEQAKNEFGENHIYVATSYNNIAVAYISQGKYDEALELLYKALDIRKSILGENHVDVATSYNNIASAYYLQGKYDEALELYYKALNIYKSILGEKHIDVANSYINIALILRYNGNFTNALEYFNKALEILMLNPEENKKYIELIIEFTTQLEQLINSNDSN